MARKGKAKVRTGCLTCKIRKVKCDEGKPNCSRCTSTGRKCDGYYQHVYWVLPQPQSQSLQPSFRRQGDARALQFFSAVVAQSFWAPHNSSFWTDHVLRLANFEDAIRHSMIAVSFVYEECSAEGVVSIELRRNEFFLRHLHSAIQHLRATKDYNLVLVGCLLFVCMEAIQRNHEQARIHAKHGLRIFQEAKATNASINSTLGPMYNRLSAMPFFLNEESSPPDLEQGQTNPSQFTSLSDAESLLEALLLRAGRLFRQGDAYRHGALRDKPVSAELLASQREIQDLIEQVRVIIAEFDQQNAQDQRENAWYHTFVIRAEICRIRALKAFDPDEEHYDTFNDAFRRITRLAQHPGCAMRMLSDSALETAFRSEIGYPQLVYFITTKCRDLATRLMALKLLRKYINSPESDHYDLKKLYMCSRRIIEVEHNLSLNSWDQPAGPVTWTDLPSEAARVLDTFADPYDITRAKVKGQFIVGNPEGFIMRSVHGGLCLRIEFIEVAPTGDKGKTEFVQLENSLTRLYAPLHDHGQAVSKLRRRDWDNSP